MDCLQINQKHLLANGFTIGVKSIVVTFIVSIFCIGYSDCAIFPLRLILNERT